MDPLPPVDPPEFKYPRITERIDRQQLQKLDDVALEFADEDRTRSSNALVVSNSQPAFAPGPSYEVNKEVKTKFVNQTVESLASRYEANVGADQEEDTEAFRYDEGLLKRIGPRKAPNAEKNPPVPAHMIFQPPATKAEFQEQVRAYRKDRDEEKNAEGHKTAYDTRSLSDVEWKHRQYIQQHLGRETDYKTQKARRDKMAQEKKPPESSDE